MMNIKNFIKGETSPTNAITALRRDAAFIWNAVIVVVFVSFVGLAVGSAMLDLISIRH